LGDVGVDLLDLLDGPRKVPAKSGAGRGLIGAESQHDGPLGVVDFVKARQRPYPEKRDEAGSNHAAAQAGLGGPAASAASAPEHRRELALEIPHDGVEVGRPLLAAASPRIAFIAVVPSHRELRLSYEGIFREPF